MTKKEIEERADEYWNRDQTRSGMVKLIVEIARAVREEDAKLAESRTFTHVCQNCNLSESEERRARSRRYAAKEIATAIRAKLAELKEQP